MRAMMSAIVMTVGMSSAAVAVQMAVTVLYQTSFADSTVKNGSHTAHRSVSK